MAWKLLANFLFWWWRKQLSSIKLQLWKHQAKDHFFQLFADVMPNHQQSNFDATKINPKPSIKYQGHQIWKWLPNIISEDLRAQFFSNSSPSYYKDYLASCKFGVQNINGLVVVSHNGDGKFAKSAAANLKTAVLGSGNWDVRSRRNREEDGFHFARASIWMLLQHPGLWEQFCPKKPLTRPKVRLAPQK